MTTTQPERPPRGNPTGPTVAIFGYDVVTTTDDATGVVTVTAVDLSAPPAPPPVVEPPDPEPDPAA